MGWFGFSENLNTYKLKFRIAKTKFTKTQEQESQDGLRRDVHRRLRQEHQLGEGPLTPSHQEVHHRQQQREVHRRSRRARLEGRYGRWASRPGVHQSTVRCNRRRKGRHRAQEEVSLGHETNKPEGLTFMSSPQTRWVNHHKNHKQTKCHVTLHGVSDNSKVHLTNLGLEQ